MDQYDHFCVVVQVVTNEAIYSPERDMPVISVPTSRMP
jgi:hypothetical protein